MSSTARPLHCGCPSCNGPKPAANSSLLHYIHYSACCRDASPNPADKISKSQAGCSHAEHGHHPPIYLTLQTGVYALICLNCCSVRLHDSLSDPRSHVAWRDLTPLPHTEFPVSRVSLTMLAWARKHLR